ncbi:hypothetical protein [Bacillus niameyensis]|uniref:hypothetical protein n=1 Tax=Bacillus niameyensis TaxID=1522308 RepID=UPI0007811C0E|nr:hypothetical protein [Bacillus niameyensis]
MQQNIIVSEANEKEHLLDVLRMRKRLEKHIANSVPNYVQEDENKFLQGLKSYFNDPNAKIHIASLPNTNESLVWALVCLNTMMTLK